MATIALPNSTTPGAWQTIINSNPGANEFVIPAGLSREQKIQVNASYHNAIFTLTPGADVRGSRVLSSWSGSGPWTHSFTTALSPTAHSCEAEYPLCNRNDQLFRDGQPLRQVNTIDELDYSSYFINYSTNIITVTFNPNALLMEIATTDRFIYPVTTAADGVQVRGPGIVQQYAPPVQNSALSMTNSSLRCAGWHIYDGLRLLLNTSVCVSLTNRAGGDPTLMEDVEASHGGQMCIKAVGAAGDLAEGITVRRCTFREGNLWKGVSGGFEAGQSKFVRTKGMEILDSYWYDAGASAIWFDIDNVSPLIQRNQIIRAWGEAVKLEIGYGAEVLDNIAQQCGLRNFNRNDQGTWWYWGAAFHSQNTVNAKFRRNIVEDCGRGIVATQQNRGTGEFGQYRCYGVEVTDNIVRNIRRRGGAGVGTICAGAGGDHEATTLFDGSQPMVFDRNHYFAEHTQFGWDSDGGYTWEEWRAFGNDPNGTMNGRY